MTMWKVVVCPDENEHALEMFVRESIIAIGYPGNEECSAVQKFRNIPVGDLIVAHLSSKRHHTTKTAAGVARVTRGYHIVRDLPASEWRDGPRRQLGVQWLATDIVRMPDVFRSRRVYRPTVVRLNDELAAQVLHRYGLDA